MNTFMSKINWFGLAGGITTIMVVLVSLLVPWWQLTVGDDLLKANASPVNTNFSFLDTTFTIPLIWAFNIVSLLTLISSGVAMLIYSVLPTKSYSKQLLSFGYKKPLFTVLFFVVGLVVITLILQTVLNISVPLMGSTTSPLSLPFASDVSISVLMSAAFLWPFWLAAVAAGLCLAARLYHKRVATAAQKPATATATTAPPTSPPKTAAT
jgi:hypothetical protein